MAKLRVFFDGAGSGHGNMARDQELLETHVPGDDPILRIYWWQPAAVTIGYNQNFSDFDADTIAAKGYEMVRRPTGGRAILHADELTYAVVGTSPSTLFGDSLHSTYMKINEALMLFLHSLGIAADISDGESRADSRGLVCFRSAGKHEISVGGRKIVGSAQRRTNGVFLQHGSILAGPGHLELPRLLGTEGAEASDAKQLAAATTDLTQVLGVVQTPEILASQALLLADSFAEALPLKLDVVTSHLP
ncbi:MAG: lipoate-protein ligase A [Candidatus Krumholzibacteriia bacterium]